MSTFVEKMTPQEAFECIIQATVAGPFATARRARDYVTRGEPIPESLLPGRLIMRLPTSVRGALTKLTASMTMHRTDWVRLLVEEGASR